MPPFFPPRPKRESIRTSITYEHCSSENPFVAKKTLWHGYDAEKLAVGYGWTEMLFLLSQGELPSDTQNQQLNTLMTFLANPGPRDAAVRAAMNCGVGKTPLPTILTTGLTVRGGMADGAMHVEAAMRLLRGGFSEAENSPPEQLIDDYRTFQAEHRDDEIVPWPEVPPGFGLHYGGRDLRAEKLLAITEEQHDKYLRWARFIEMQLAMEHEPQYLTLPGVTAAILCDLGFSAEHGAGVYMIAGSAGILAHGVEQLPRNWNEYPFWADPSYYHYDGPDALHRVDNS